MTYIATGSQFQAYLDAARQNLEALVKLAATDADFHSAADNLFTAFNDYAEDCQDLIDRANAPFDGESDLVSYPTGYEARALANRSVEQ